MADSDSSTQIPIESLRALEAENNKISTLTNPLEEEFVHSYNGVPYTVLPGVNQFPHYLAKHLAKHLMQFIMIHHAGRFEDKMIEGKRIPQVVGRKELLESCMMLVNAEEGELAMEEIPSEDSTSKKPKRKVVKKKKATKKKAAPKKKVEAVEEVAESLKEE